MPRSRPFRSRLLLILLALPALGLPPAAAQTAYYGAFSFSPSNGAVGWGFDYPTRQEAIEAALANCRKHASDCRLAISVRNSCAAIGIAERRFIVSDDYTPATALFKIRRECARMSADTCELLKVLCTTTADQ